MTVTLEQADTSDDKCHDELRNKCGKQIDELKKNIEKTSIIGILKGAVDVVQCLAENAEDLWKKCTSSSQADEVATFELSLIDDFQKVTHKPSHRGAQSSSHKPTRKPTPKHILEVVVQENALIESAELDSMPFIEDSMPNAPEVSSISLLQGEVFSSVEYDMDACVRSARVHCSSEVQSFNESPFDRNLLQRLNDCIERNARIIEAECSVSKSTFVSFLPSFDYAFHEPCRHQDEPISNLPLCAESHKCRHGKAMKIVLAVLLTLVSVIVSVRLVRRCVYGNKQCKRCKRCPRSAVEVPTQKAGYFPLNDNGEPVTANVV